MAEDNDSANKDKPAMAEDPNTLHVLNQQRNWDTLYFYQKWSDEQMCNYAITLCHFIDKMMMSFLKKLEQEFITEGGIKERMHRARTAYRQQQDARLKQLEEELPRLKQALTEAQAEAAKWKAAFEDIKQRALKAYYRQEAEIKELKEKLDSLKGSKEL